MIPITHQMLKKDFRRDLTDKIVLTDAQWGFGTK